MAKLTVEIVTPEKRILSVQADEAIVTGGLGLFGVRPGHNFQCRACSPCLLHDLAGLEGLRDSHKQPPCRREIGHGQHFWISGIAHHHFRAIAAGRPDGSIDLIEHQQLPASRREAASEERANSSVSDDHIVILERRHGEWRSGTGLR